MEKHRWHAGQGSKPNTWERRRARSYADAKIGGVLALSMTSLPLEAIVPALYLQLPGQLSDKHHNLVVIQARLGISRLLLSDLQDRALHQLSYPRPALHSAQATLHHKRQLFTSDICRCTTDRLGEPSEASASASASACPVYDCVYPSTYACRPHAVSA